MTLPLYQVDAFSSHIFRGNPAAVCPLDSWPDDATMQSVAAENNLAETAFFIPTSEGYHIRWFTPKTEVDLCGHATLASAHVLFEHLAYSEETILFHSRSGALRVTRESGMLAMDFPADPPEPVTPLPNLEAALGVKARACFKGRDDLMVLLDDEKEILHLNPDLRRLATLPCRGVIATAPGENVDFVSRFFAPQSGIDEDPVTGSAHTTLTPYWADLLNKPVLTARQLSARGGELICELNGERVIIRGDAVTYLVGEIFI
jgi:PhzF family phenazine biosynthesis protein